MLIFVRLYVAWLEQFRDNIIIMRIGLASTRIQVNIVHTILLLRHIQVEVIQLYISDSSF